MTDLLSLPDVPIEDPTQRRTAISKLASAADWLFGFLALVGLLALCSVIPLLNFLSLGYLLHVSGRVAATGRIGAGFVGVRKASVFGTIAAGTWIATWPATLMLGMWRDAELISPGSGTARAWYAGWVALTAFTFVHLLWSCARGGKLWHFLWPQPMRLLRWLGGPSKFRVLWDAFWRYLVALRLPFYFWLGLRGFVGAAMWLAVPVGVLMLATLLPAVGAALLSLVGGLILAFVAVHLPFLQARFATQNDFNAFFDLRSVRDFFARAPFAFWLALLVTLLFALPLYLLKVELTPRDLAWLPAILFVVFILPARILTGWAMGRALKRELPRHWAAMWTARLGIIPIAVAYALVVYATPYFSWNGVRSLLEQHAFLVPAPLMAL